MIADILTNPLAQSQTHKLRQLLQLVEMQELKGSDVIEETRRDAIDDMISATDLAQESVGGDWKELNNKQFELREFFTGLL